MSLSDKTETFLYKLTIATTESYCTTHYAFSIHNSQYVYRVAYIIGL